MSTDPDLGKLRIDRASGSFGGGKYRVFASLGRGGMADVQLGAAQGPKGFNKLVVIKRLRAQIADDLAVVNMFLDEARLAARLNHPNVIHTYEFGEERGAYFIAMEYLDGQSLASILRAARAANRAVAPALWAKIVADGLAGLHYVHELADYDGSPLGVVHRDVSPQNIVVTHEGHVKLVDFGIAKTRVNVTETESQIIKGKLAYMAPEQLEPAPGGPPDRRVDVFAAGIVLWECLAGERLITGDARAAITKIVDMEFPAPSRRNPAVPPELDAITLRALQRAPERRYETAHEMRAAIEAFLRASGEVIGEAQIGGLVDSLFAREHEAARRDIRRHMERLGSERELDVASADSGALGADESEPATGEDRPTLGAIPESGRSLRAVRTKSAHRWAGPPRSRKLGLAAGVGVGALLAAGLLGLRAHSRSGPDVATASRSSSVIVSDAAAARAPMVASLVPGALQSYEVGMAALRDGDVGGAKAGFTRACELDPLFAAAHLRAAWWTSVGTPTESRVHFERAMELRASLRPRDEALLRAFEPELYRLPVDLDESERRLTEALVRFPGDAELLFYTGRARQHLGRSREAIATFDAALAVDPSFAIAWWSRGNAQEDEGDVTGALASYDRCLEVSPAAASCLIDRAWFHAVHGHCDRLEADARRVTVIKPDSAHGYDMLARAFVARDSPATDEAFRHLWAALPEARRARAALYDRGQLAAVRGDFARAIRLATELSALVSGSSAELDQSEPARQLLDAYTEIGDFARAAQIAGAFLERREAWSPAPSVGDSVSQGAPPVMLAAQRRAGAITAAAFEERRDAWARDAFATLAPDARGEFWYVAFAAPVETPADAARALAALADYPIGQHARHLSGADALMGLVLARAGRPAAALPRLEAATAACTVIDVPYLQLRSAFELGQVEETLGDAPGACASYARLVARWGDAKPASRTAERATARMHALRCGPPVASAPPR